MALGAPREATSSFFSCISFSLLSPLWCGTQGGQGCHQAAIRRSRTWGYPCPYPTKLEGLVLRRGG